MTQPIRPMTNDQALAYLEGLADQEAKAADDAILAGILRRLLTGSPDLFRIDDDALHVYTRLDLSDTEADAIRRVLDQ
jgi:hypothetical protein